MKKVSKRKMLKDYEECLSAWTTLHSYHRSCIADARLSGYFYDKMKQLDFTDKNARNQFMNKEVNNVWSINGALEYASLKRGIISSNILREPTIIDLESDKLKELFIMLSKLDTSDKKSQTEIISKFLGKEKAKKVASAAEIRYSSFEQRMDKYIARIKSTNEELMRNAYGTRKETTGNMNIEEKVAYADYVVGQMAKASDVADSRLDNKHQLVKSYSNVYPYDSGVDSTDYMDR